MRTCLAIAALTITMVESLAVAQTSGAQSSQQEKLSSLEFVAQRADRYSKMTECIVGAIELPNAEEGLESAIDKSVDKCERELTRVRAVYLSEGYSETEVSSIEAAEMASLKSGAMVVFAKEVEKSKIRSTVRLAYNDAKDCSTKTALQYQDLKKGDLDYFVAFVARECAGSAVDAMMKLNSIPDTQSVKDLLPFVTTCGSVAAMHNLRFLSDAQIAKHRKGCTETLSIVDQRFP